MKGGGMDFSALAQQMGATMGGGAGAGGAAAEIERSRRETPTRDRTLTRTRTLSLTLTRTLSLALTLALSNRSPEPGQVEAGERDAQAAHEQQGRVVRRVVSKHQARARRHLGSKVAVRYGSKEAVKRQHASATQGEA